MTALPNLLTLARVVLTPLVAVLILRGSYGPALAWLAVAGVTDGLDGLVARRFGWSSRAGALLDPVADKVLLVTVYIAMAIAELVPGWLVILVVGRDVLILACAGLAFLFTNVRSFPPSRWGKLSTLIQMLTGVLVIGSRAVGSTSLVAYAAVMIVVTAVATAWSGLDYGWRAALALRAGRSARRAEARRPARKPDPTR